MHLLPCPHCQASIVVSPSQAGDETTCPECQASVAIPKLGDIRQLPLADEEPTVQATAQGEPSSWHSAAFLVLGLIATASLLIAGFCGIRWSLIEVPGTTEEHIATYRQEYAALTAAELIREYEQMERVTLDLGGPYKYKRDEMTRNKWGKNASIAAGVGGLAILAAIAVAVSGRRNRP